MDRTWGAVFKVTLLSLYKLPDIHKNLTFLLPARKDHFNLKSFNADLSDDAPVMSCEAMCDKNLIMVLEGREVSLSCVPHTLHQLSCLQSTFSFSKTQNHIMKESSTARPTLSLLNLLKLSVFRPIYAATSSNSTSSCPSPRRDRIKNPEVIISSPDDSAPKKCACGPDGNCRKHESDHIRDNSKNGSGELGKTGAGVLGSRSFKFTPIRATQFSPVYPMPDMRDDEMPTSAINPGLLRHIHNAARLRIPQCFEGACVSVKQHAGGNWILGHKLLFSSVSPGGYKMLLSYVEKDKVTRLPYFVLEAAPGGQMSTEIRVAPTSGSRAAVVAQVADTALYSFESTLDMFFGSNTASIIAVNREFLALHYLQSITEKLSLGAEVVARGQSELSSASGAARWASDTSAYSATLGNRGLDFCYARVLQPYLTVAGMLEIGFAVKHAVATLAYEWHTDVFTVRASADSDGLVGATVQHELGGKTADLTCCLSALLNHPNDKFRLGFGISASIK